jgi:hypothetical protein
MSSPGDFGLHSPETTGTVNGRPSPLNDRKQDFGTGKRMGYPGDTHGDFMEISVATKIVDDPW